MLALKMWRSVLVELFRLWEEVFLCVAIGALNGFFAFILPPYMSHLFISVFVLYALAVYFCIFFF